MTNTVSNWNLPNTLTGLRVVMVPAYCYFLYSQFENPWFRTIASLIFVAAMITDHLDGHIARSRNLITNFGKIADPIADKALIGASLIIFSTLGVVWWWVSILILVREIGITVMRFTVLRYGVIPAAAAGKWKTVLQAIALGMLSVPMEMVWHGWVYLSYTVLGVATVLTLTSGAEYLVHGVKLRREHVGRAS